MATQYNVQILQDLEAVERIDADWDALETCSPMRHPWWLLNWWTAFQPHGELYVMTARDPQNRLVGVLPLYRQRGPQQRRCLRSLGDEVVCTDYFGISASTEHQQSVAEAFALWLAQHWRDPDCGWDRIELDGVAANDPVMSTWCSTLKAHDASFHATSRSHFWRLPTTTSWDQLLSETSRGQRRALRKRRREIEAIDGLEIRHPQCPAEVTQLVDKTIELHQRRWNAEGEPGSFHDPRCIAFIHQVALQAWEQDQLHLQVWYHDQRPVAAELGFLSRDNCLFIYTLGREPDCEVASWGLLLIVGLEIEARQTHLEAVDFLRGDEPYKARSHAEPTACQTIRIIAPNFSNRLLHGLWLTQFEVSQFLRRRTGRTPYEVQT